MHRSTPSKLFGPSECAALAEMLNMLYALDASHLHRSMATCWSWYAAVFCPDNVRCCFGRHAAGERIMPKVVQTKLPQTLKPSLKPKQTGARTHTHTHRYAYARTHARTHTHRGQSQPLVLLLVLLLQNCPVTGLTVQLSRFHDDSPVMPLWALATARLRTIDPTR